MKNSNNPKIRFIIAAVILIVALSISVFSYFTKTKYYQSWDSCEGIITNIEQIRIYNGKNRARRTRYRVHYTFTAEGTVREGYTDYSEKPDTYSTGDTKTIWYDPADEKMSSAHKPSPALDVFAPFCIFLPVSIGICFGRWDKRKALYSE